MPRVQAPEGLLRPRSSELLSLECFSNHKETPQVGVSCFIYRDVGDVEKGRKMGLASATDTLKGECDGVKMTQNRGLIKRMLA